MASPAAILSILVDANSTEATAKLSKFDKQLAAVNDTAKRGVTAKLGGTFNPEAFNAYQERVARAARVAKDRAAFKAELGANFNASAFNSYERSIDKANRTTRTLEEHNRGLRSSFGGLRSSILAAGGAFAVFEGAKTAIESTIELAHNTEKLSAVTGLDAKSASTWIEVMKVRGVSARQTAMAFITLSKQITAAQDSSKKQSAGMSTLAAKQKAQTAALIASGASHKAILALQHSQQLATASLTTQTGKAAAAFKELGVSQGALKSGNTLEVLRQAADGLSKIQDPARRAALAQQMFGRGAQALLPILEHGSKGVDEALAAAQRYGAFLPKNVKQLKAAHDAQLNLNLAMDGLKIAFTRTVLPALVVAAGKLMTFIAQMRSGKGAGGDFAKALSSAFNVVKTVVKDVIGVFGGLGNAVKAVLIVFAAMKIASFFQSVIALANPTTLVIVAFAAAALLIIKNWKTVGPFLTSLWNNIRATAEPVIRWLVNAWGNATHAVATVAQAVFPTVKAIVEVAFAAIKVALAVLKTEFDIAWNFIGPLVRGAITVIKGAITNVLIPAFNLVKGPVKFLAGLFVDQFNIIKSIVGHVIDFVLGMLSSFLHASGGVFDVLSKIPLLGGAFKGLSGDVNHAADTIDNLRRTLKGLPAKTTVGVSVNFLSNIGGFIAAIGNAIDGVTGAKQSPVPKRGGHFARGGMVTKLGYFAGEDGPQHPEVIIASNPAYRERNVKLWQRAGKMLGIPGYATGGVTPASQSTGAQTREATLANLLQTAQNGGNTVAQQRALNSEVGLERSLLSADREQLAKIIRELGGQLKAARRAQLQQDKLSVLQAIGGVLSNLGTASSSLASLSTATAAGPGSFDLAPTGAAVKLPTVFDVRHAIGHGGGGQIHKGVTGDVHVTNHIHVSRDVDVAKVADAIDRATNGNLHAHMRRAGMRGT